MWVCFGLLPKLPNSIPSISNSVVTFWARKLRGRSGGQSLSLQYSSLSYSPAKRQNITSLCWRATLLRRIKYDITVWYDGTLGKWERACFERGTFNTLYACSKNNGNLVYDKLNVCTVPIFGARSFEIILFNEEALIEQDAYGTLTSWENISPCIAISLWVCVS